MGESPSRPGESSHHRGPTSAPPLLAERRAAHTADPDDTLSWEEVTEQAAEREIEAALEPGRSALPGLEADPPGTEPVRVDAAVLKVGERSARVRIPGEDGQVTFRSGGLWSVFPGHVVTVDLERRWSWRGDAYASGKLRNPRIDVAKLGLDPLPLEGGEIEDLASCSEPYRPPDPYAPLWETLTAQPRRCFRFDGIAWGMLPGLSPEENPTCRAAELIAAGDREHARELLMTVLVADLRCLDAHAHLGNLEIDRSPERAIVHYEIGTRIGELSLPTGFDGLLVWGQVFNRPFLRCLHGWGSSLWRLERHAEAEEVFERLLSLDPTDSQGARFCWHDVRQGRSWEQMQEPEEAMAERHAPQS